MKPSHDPRSGGIGTGSDRGRPLLALLLPWPSSIQRRRLRRLSLTTWTRATYSSIRARDGALSSLRTLDDTKVAHYSDGCPLSTCIRWVMLMGSWTWFLHLYCHVTRPGQRQQVQAQPWVFIYTFGMSTSLRLLPSSTPPLYFIPCQLFHLVLVSSFLPFHSLFSLGREFSGLVLSTSAYCYTFVYIYA